MPNKHITVQMEVEWDDEETHEVYSVLPVHVNTNDLTETELTAVRHYLRTDDDASFDFMWDLRGLLRGENIE